jgi:UDP-N-acetylglucosamine transferase subunit ALG13
MIFVTVGTQLAFDRMISAIDEWAGRRRQKNVFAQIGVSDLKPKNIEWVQSLTQPAFKKCMQEADLIVSHAGMGTILTALDLNKPIIIMPRRAILGEHRNDHQLATTRELTQRGLVASAEDTEALVRQLDEPTHRKNKRKTTLENALRLNHFVRNFVAETANVR